MFDELGKYKENGHFFFNSKDKLEKVCNAPNDKSGVYLVYVLKNGRVELVYVGKSGKKMDDGTIFIRKVGLGGIKDRIVNGHQFGKIPRKTSWVAIMNYEKIEALDIYWYITHSENYADCPSVIEKILLVEYRNIYGRLPNWNSKG